MGKRFSIGQLDKFTDFVNNEISGLSTLNHIPLGPGYAELPYEEAQNNLCVHRIASKFEKPNKSNASKRKRETLQKCFDYDASGPVEFNPAKMVLVPSVRKQLYETRALLHTVISQYMFDVGFAEITTGETFISASGDTSILAKLRDEKQWCVTPECFDLFASVAYRTKALKKQAMRFYRQRMIKHYNLFIAQCKFFIDEDDTKALVKRASKYFWRRKLKDDSRKLYEKHKDSKHVGFSVFKDRLKQIVTFVGGTRFTTVLKNNSGDRVIECEAFCNMITQRIIAFGIKKVIKKAFKIELTKAQDVHKSMISDLSYATVDLKNASNSVWSSVVEWFMGGTRLHSHVKASRSGHVMSNGDWFYLNMVAPMGNGYTFELMTLILLCLTRTLDKTSRVYGDDIIIKAEYSTQLTEALKACGFILNETKTFTHGNFRESCGGFTCEGAYITSYEFHWASDIADAIVNVNKLGIIARKCTGTIGRALTDAYSRILEVVPLLCCKGVTSDNTTLDGSVFVKLRYLKRLLSRCKEHSKLMDLMKPSRTTATTDLQYQEHSLHAGYRFYKDSTPYKNVPIVVRHDHWLWFYLYNGRRMAPQRRRERLIRETVLHTGSQTYLVSENLVLATP